MGIKILDTIGFKPGSIVKSIDESLAEIRGKVPEAEFKRKEDFLKNTIGRRIRHLAAEGETGLSLGIDAAKEALNGNNLKSTDIDLVIFVAQNPEYTTPTCSMIALDALGGNPTAMCFDMNANCVGMLTAINVASSMLKANESMQNALVIQGDTLGTKVDILENFDTVLYSELGDTGTALVLSKTRSRSSILEMRSAINSTKVMLDIERPGNRKVITGKGGDAYLDLGVGMIQDMLQRRGITTRDVTSYCLSQSALCNFEYVASQLKLDKEQAEYVGDEYGYTAAGSPIHAFHKALQKGKIKRGDYVVFWTVASGIQHEALLIKY